MYVRTSRCFPNEPPAQYSRATCVRWKRVGQLGAAVLERQDGLRVRVHACVISVDNAEISLVEYAHHFLKKKQSSALYRKASLLPYPYIISSRCISLANEAVLAHRNFTALFSILTYTALTNGFFYHRKVRD